MRTEIIASLIGSWLVTSSGSIWWCWWKQCARREVGRLDKDWIQSILQTGQDASGRIMMSGVGNLQELHSVSMKVCCRLQQTVMALSQRAEQLDSTKRIKLVFKLGLLLNYFSFITSQICQMNKTQTAHFLTFSINLPFLSSLTHILIPEEFLQSVLSSTCCS